MTDSASGASRQRRLERLVEGGAVAVLRTEEPSRLPGLASALLDGGISAIEITMTTPQALDAIRAVRQSMGKRGIVGVGSVTDAQMARKAVGAGAQFVVSPIFREPIVRVAHEEERPAIPGALTPTEVQRAHEAGADLVKVFPASMGGAGYIRSLKAPLPHLDLMPTGGVSLDGAGDWIEAGASVVGVGSALMEGVGEGDEAHDRVTRNARRLRRSVASARESRG